MASQEDVDMTTEPAPKPTTTITTTNKSTQQQQRRITSRNPQWTYFKLQLYVTLYTCGLRISSDIK
jgi:ribonuclease P/MRP protein subunit POP8